MTPPSRRRVPHPRGSTTPDLTGGRYGTWSGLARPFAWRLWLACGSWSAVAWRAWLACGVAAAVWWAAGGSRGAGTAVAFGAVVALGEALRVGGEGAGRDGAPLATAGALGYALLGSHDGSGAVRAVCLALAATAAGTAIRKARRPARPPSPAPGEAPQPAPVPQDPDPTARPPAPAGPARSTTWPLLPGPDAAPRPSAPAGPAGSTTWPLLSGPDPAPRPPAPAGPERPETRSVPHAPTAAAHPTPPSGPRRRHVAPSAPASRTPARARRAAGRLPAAARSAPDLRILRIRARARRAARSAPDLRARARARLAALVPAVSRIAPRRAAVVAVAAVCCQPLGGAWELAGAARAGYLVGVLAVAAGWDALLSAVTAPSFAAGLRDHVAALARTGPAVGAGGVVFALAVDGAGPWAVPLVAVPLLPAQLSLRGQAAVRATYRETVASLVRATEVAGYTPPGHAGRVSALATAVGRELGLTARRLDVLEHAALMHDIGQLSLVDPLPLGATEPLDDERRREVAALGGEVVRRTGAPPDVALVVERQAHPYREQPLAGRIVRVANAYEDFSGAAAAGPQPLHTRLAVLERMRLATAYDYDPRVVDALTRVLARQSGRAWLDARAEGKEDP